MFGSLCSSEVNVLSKTKVSEKYIFCIIDMKTMQLICEAAHGNNSETKLEWHWR